MAYGENDKYNKDTKSLPFLHKGETHYMYKGRFIDAMSYAMQADMGLAEKEIFKQYGKKVEPILPHPDQPKIHNVKELMEFMYSVMTDKWCDKIKGNIKKGMTAQQVFAQFPKEFQPILRLRYLKDKGHKGQAPEVKKMVKSISRDMILKGE